MFCRTSILEVDGHLMYKWCRQYADVCSILQYDFLRCQSFNLLGAANGRGILNPMVVVQGQVYQIVSGGPTVDDLLHGWTVVGHENSVMYPGSTTGQSWDNSVCSPYAITWHVDKECHQVSPESFDNLCKVMKETYNMEADLYPHGSRKLVDSKFVVTAEYVKPLA